MSGKSSKPKPNPEKVSQKPKTTTTTYCDCAVVEKCGHDVDESDEAGASGGKSTVDFDSDYEHKVVLVRTSGFGGILLYLSLIIRLKLHLNITIHRCGLF